VRRHRLCGTVLCPLGNGQEDVESFYREGGIVAMPQQKQEKQHPMQSPMDLFVHELSDIHQAEQIIAQTLGEAQGLVRNPQLKQALQQHQQETQQQAQNVKRVIEMLGQRPHPVVCHAVEGLRTELKDAQKAKPSPEILEGLVVAGGQKTEHYEIAAYTGLVKKARLMGQTEAAQLLQQNLQQEQQALQKLEQIGDQLAQQMAATMSQAGQLGMQAQQTGGQAG
jgi:ferritin-like metal-binding protein YciE